MFYEIDNIGYESTSIKPVIKKAMKQAKRKYNRNKEFTNHCVVSIGIYDTWRDFRGLILVSYGSNGYFFTGNYR